MSDFATFLALTTVMGLSIFLSLPIILAKRMQSRTILFLNAVAVGILIFLLADIFGDVATVIAGSASYLTNPYLDALFLAGVAGIFATLYFIDQRRPPAETSPGTGGVSASVDPSPTRLALIIALGIGLQNLTEGLLFGNSWTLGEVGLIGVIFFGFLLQNITEGFPIVSPLLGRDQRDLLLVAGFFLIGGLPTIVGGVIGYFYVSTTLVVLFDAMAIGAILYVILPMLRALLRAEPTRLESYRRYRLVYFGLLAGFVLGFVVNAF